MLPLAIQNKINSLRLRLKELIVLSGIARLIVIVFGLLLFFLIADWTFEFSSGLRVIAGIGFIIVCAAAAFDFIIRPLTIPMPDDQIALLYEKKFPELHDVLVSAVQLEQQAEYASSALVSSLMKDAEAAAETLQPKQVPQTLRLRKRVVYAIISVAFAAGFSFYTPKTAGTFAARFLHPFGGAQWPKNTELILQIAGSPNHEVVVPKGEQVAVKVVARNARNLPIWSPPGRVRLEYRYDSGSVRTFPMRKTEEAVYQAAFPELHDDVIVVARAGNAESLPVRVKVIELPFIEDLWVSCEHPKYTGLPSDQPSRSVSEVRAVAGTKVKIELKPSKPLGGGCADIILDPPQTLKMTPASGSGGATHAASIELKPGMKWLRVELSDVSGLKSKQPRVVQLEVVEDKRPSLRITKPGGQIRCTPYATVPLEIEITDDYSVKDAWLRFTTGPQEEPQKQALAAEKSREFTIKYRWDISELKLKVGQNVQYRAEADDNCNTYPAGSEGANRVGKSDEFYITVVSSADLASELDQRLFALRNDVKKTKTRQEDSRRNIIELLTKISEARPLTNEDRGMAADIESLQHDLARTISRISDEVGRIREAMQDNRIGSFADRRRLEEIQESLKQVAVTEMPNAAEFIKAARKDLSSVDGRDNLQSGSRVNTAIIERLEKILASMSHNEDINNLVRTARELLRKEIAIKDDTVEFGKRPDAVGAKVADLKPSDSSALNLVTRTQRSARDDMRNLEQDMIDVAERLKATDSRRAEIIRQAQAKAGEDQIGVQMEEAADSLSNNKIGLATLSEDNAIKGLEQLLKTLESAREEEASNEALAQAAKELRQALQQVQKLIKDEEGHIGDISEVEQDQAQADRLKQLKEKLGAMRQKQKDIAQEAPKTDQLGELKDPQDKLQGEAKDAAEALSGEQKEAESREAEQAEAVKDAADATSEAEAKMGESSKNMEGKDAQGASKSAENAEKKLGEAEQALEKAIEGIEKKLADKAREAGVKQGETAKKADKVAEEMKQSAQNQQENSEEASESLEQASEDVKQAGGEMQQSSQSMQQQKSSQGKQSAQSAKQKLQDAQKKLQETLEDVENKMKEQTLIDLLVELQPMLEKQIEINDETRRIDESTIKEQLPEPSRPHKVRLGQLTSDEAALNTKAKELFRKIQEEDAPVFVWGFEKLTRDMSEMTTRLGAFQTDMYSQELGKDIADTLRMLIDSLKEELSDMQEEDQQGGGGGQGGGKPKLVPPIAQLKLLRARELEIHNGTRRLELRRLTRPDQKLIPMEQKRVEKLAAEQSELGELTQKFAEALDRAAEEEMQQQQRDQRLPEGW